MACMKDQELIAHFIEVFGQPPTRALFEAFREYIAQRTEMIVKVGLLHRAAHETGMPVPMQILCDLMSEIEHECIVDDADGQYLANQIEQRFAAAKQQAQRDMAGVKPAMQIAFEQAMAVFNQKVEDVQEASVSMFGPHTASTIKH